MIAIIKREFKNYLKHPLFWLGLLVVIWGMFGNLRPYLEIGYIENLPEVSQEDAQIQYHPDADISDGFVPTPQEFRRKFWEEEVEQTLVSEFEMSREESAGVIAEMKDMETRDACRYLEETYGYYGAWYTYEDTAYHRGTVEEINACIKENLKEHSFSYYFSRKFADFAGLFLAFFSTVMLSVLFYQDTRKNTYELLHTKPVSPGSYVAGKAAGGFLVCAFALFILNVLFFLLCLFYTREDGFEVHFMDFLVNSCLYVLPNLLMIVCVYELVSLLFKTPLPAVPFLFLYMLYSNLGSRDAQGVYGYYGKMFAIMVRFPGNIFDTAPPPGALFNQCFLLCACGGILILSVRLWRRRRI